ncbi:hypothetical protein Glove_87g97 [Diversispora epigaea]|uniref:Uncharacterized protein n=1 Tax=Diversispora epigaea TaxID=1348612 RepID=A0A397JFP4_9GLOM|nr:hypothetical protein Glove_87g97 [Diversispora epigaea]
MRIDFDKIIVLYQRIEKEAVDYCTKGVVRDEKLTFMKMIEMMIKVVSVVDDDSETT